MQPTERVKIWSMMVCAGLASCSSRDVPATWPEQSAASPHSSAAPVAVVTQALDSHPPLPGQGRTGWVGLDGSEAPAHRHDTGEHDSPHDSPRGSPEHGAAEQHPAEHSLPTGAAAEDAAVYTCPMHPDVVANSPGKCPRCGMNLVKRDAPK
jgi:heavy metal-binding protein